MKIYKIELNEQQIELVYQALAEQPYRLVSQVIDHIKIQFQRQRETNNLNKEKDVGKSDNKAVKG